MLLMFTETISAVIAVISGFHAPLTPHKKKRRRSFYLVQRQSCVSMNRNAGDRLQGLLSISFQTAVGSTSLPWY